MERRPWFMDELNHAGDEHLDPRLRGGVRPQGGLRPDARLSLTAQLRVQRGEHAHRLPYWYLRIRPSRQVCQEFLARGKLVYLEGRLRTREWEGKDGFRRFTTEIVIDILQMLSPRAGVPAPEFLETTPAPEPPGPVPEAPHSRRGRRVRSSARYRSP
jgi:single-strand DNA-binding protein